MLRCDQRSGKFLFLFFLFGKVLLWSCFPLVPLFNRSLLELGLKFFACFLECIRGVAWLRRSDEETLLKKKGDKKGK